MALKWNIYFWQNKISLLATDYNDFTEIADNL